MKTSNYLAIAFLVFIFSAITVLFVDFKGYEPEYKTKLAIKADYYNIVKEVKKDSLTLGKWNDYLSKAAKYFSTHESYPYELMRSSRFVYENYKKFNDIDALNKVKNRIEKAYKKSPKNPHINDVYACILFNLGFIEKAVELEKFALQEITKILPKKAKVIWTDYGLDTIRLRALKKFTTIDTIIVIEPYTLRLEKFKKALAEKDSIDQNQ